MMKENIEIKAGDYIEGTETNRAVIMTPDLKCIVRGSDKTFFDLCLTTEPSKRTIKEFKGVKTADKFIKSHIDCYIYSRIRISEAVQKHYGIDLKYCDNKLLKLVPVKVKKRLVFDSVGK